MRCRRQTPVVAMVMTVWLVVTVLTPTVHGLTTADLEVTTDSLTASTFGSHGSGETTDSESTVATDPDSKPAATSVVTTSPVSADVTVTTETMTSLQTQLKNVISTVEHSNVMHTLITTAALVTELKVTDLQNLKITDLRNSTSAAATEAKDLHSATSIAPWEAQGTSASQNTTEGPLVDSPSNGISGSSYTSRDAASVTLVPSLEDSSTNDIVPTASTQSTQTTIVAVIAHDSMSTASTLPTAMLTTENATQSSLTESTAAQETTSTTTSAPSLKLSGTTANEPATDNTLRVNYSTTSYLSADDLFTAETFTVTSTSSNLNSDADVTKPMESKQFTLPFVTSTIANGSAVSAVVTAALTTVNTTESSVTESVAAQVSYSTTSNPSSSSNPPSWATLGTSEIAADAYSSPSHSEQPASISEEAALLTDDISTTASTLISLKMDVPATSSTWFDRLLHSSAASQHDGATTAHVSFDSCGLTQTLTPSPPTLFTGGGSNTTESIPWTSAPTFGHTAVALTVVIAAVAFAGAALITCAFIFIKCWAVLRTCSTKKRRGSSYKENAAYGDGRSWPRNATGAAWRQARDVAAAGANASLGRSAAPTAAGTAAEDRLLSLWAGSDIVDETSPRHVHSQTAENTEHKRPGMLGDNRPDRQLNGVELSPFAASPLGARWPLTTFRGVSADYRTPVTSHSPAYTALKIEVDDRSSTGNGETRRAEANHYVSLPEGILAQTKL